MNIVTRNQFNKDKELKGKVIINQPLARQIMAYIDKKPSNVLRVIDFKPDKNDHSRSVVVFEDNEEFQKVFSSVIEDRRKKRENQHRDNKEIEENEKIKELSMKIEELTRKLNGEE